MFKSLSFDHRFDSLITALHQIDALIQIAASIDVTEFKPHLLNNYFWVASDLTHKMRLLCDELAHVKIHSQQ